MEVLFNQFNATWPCGIQTCGTKVCNLVLLQNLSTRLLEAHDSGCTLIKLLRKLNSGTLAKAHLPICSIDSHRINCEYPLGEE